MPHVSRSLVKAMASPMVRKWLFVAVDESVIGPSRRFKFGRFRAAADSRRESFGRK
jgi:hypothetical protein